MNNTLEVISVKDFGAYKNVRMRYGMFTLDVKVTLDSRVELPRGLFTDKSRFNLIVALARKAVAH